MAIDHNDYIDLRDLAEVAREAAGILEDLDGADENENYTEDDKLDAQQTLEALAKLCEEIGLDADRSDWDTVGDELERWGNGYEPTLIRDDYWTDYCKELCSDLGYLPSSLPDFISSNIDWDGVAADLESDYNDVELDGVAYKIRQS